MTTRQSIHCMLRSFALLFAIAFALACRVGAGSETEDADTTRTEPTVSRAEATLIREAEKLAETDLAAATAKLRSQSTDKSSAALDFALGVIFARAGKLDEAEKAYAAATAKLPRFARAWEALGRVRMALNKPAAAAPALTKAMQYGTPSADLWKLLGHCYLLTDRPLAAESAYRQALLLTPEDRQVILGLARTLLDRMRYRDALPLLKGLCDETPQKSEFWLLQANVYIAMDQPERAAEMLEGADRLGILKPDAQLTLGDLYFNQHLPDLAAACYEAALRSGKISAARMLRCAEALFLTGRTDMAARGLSQALDKGIEKPAEAHLLAGRIAEAQGDLDAAGKAFQAALQADPLCGQALLALGSLHWRTKEYEPAILMLERASRLRGFEAQAFVLLAQIEVELDRYAQAIEHLEAAQEIEPSPRVQRYLEQLRRLARLQPGG